MLLAVLPYPNKYHKENTDTHKTQKQNKTKNDDNYGNKNDFQLNFVLEWQFWNLKIYNWISGQTNSDYVQFEFGNSAHSAKREREREVGEGEETIVKNGVSNTKYPFDWMINQCISIYMDHKITHIHTLSPNENAFTYILSRPFSTEWCDLIKFDGWFVSCTRFTSSDDDERFCPYFSFKLYLSQSLSNLFDMLSNNCKAKQSKNKIKATRKISTNLYWNIFDIPFSMVIEIIAKYYVSINVQYSNFRRSKEIERYGNVSIEFQSF